MRIAISTLPLTTGHKDRGIGTYTRELVEVLKSQKSRHTFTFFARDSEIPKNADAVHYPFFDPFFLTLPVFRGKPTVVTVHDLIPIVFPEHFPRGIRGEVKWQVQRRNLANVTHVITDSECSKRDIIRLVGIDEAKITVVPLAPPASMTPMRDPVKLAATMERYHLPHHFAMYVGDVNWNKNIAGLLHAWQRVMARRNLPQDAKLILVGKAFTEPDLPEAIAINDVIRKLRIDDSVVQVGFVPDEDLRALYMLSHACVFPSLYEGFGLPILEAMACGGIVVSSSAASLAEVAGPSLIVDPLDPKDIASGILKACQLPTQKREDLVEEGIAWAKRFTWTKVAKQTINVYEAVGKRA
jgi:glycosyltransferase involved in cell wall biosynthesis